MELYKDKNASVKDRVEDLLSKMTLEEKVAQLCGDLAGSFIEDGEVCLDKLREIFPHGHGRFTQYSMVGLTSPHKIAKITNQIQDYFVNETRLGIPVALQSENLCGYPGKGGTLFPAQINLGCTWEETLAEKMAHIIGQESRAVGITSAMSPVIDVSYDPRWGRTYETYGEDPYLISQFGIHYVRGMQEEKVSCIAKHFLGYAFTQGGLNTAQARINDRELYEVFATPFEAAYKESKLGGMMANYGEIDGLPVIVNPKIIRTLLRDTMGFDGMLTSDGAAVLKLFNYYKIARTYEEAGYLAKKAGTDTEIPVGAAFRKLPEYVRSGQLEESCIDESVRRILKIKFDMGLFENPYCKEEDISVLMVNPEKEKVSKEIAEKSLVLLKNDGVLPLEKGKKIALVGPHADNLRYQVSGYTYPAYIEMMMAGASGQGTTFGGIADEQAKVEHEKKPKGPFASMMDMFSEEDKAQLQDMNSVLREMGAKTLKETLEKDNEVLYAKGCDIISEDTSGFAEAIENGKQADVIVMALGGNCGWVNVTGGEGKDRQYLSLPGVQEELLEEMMNLGKPVVVVLYGPGVFCVNEADKKASAILQAFMPGQFASEAITNVLFGDVNPSGKLTMTIPRSEGQIPIYYHHKTGSGYLSGGDQASASIFSGGYVAGGADPLYPFGHGLSYTEFEIRDLKVESSQVPTNGEVVASCKIKNVGTRKGADVVQLYTHFFGAHVTRPEMELKGYKRVELEPQEEKEVTFTIPTSLLAYYNEEMEYVCEPGDLTILVGDASNRIVEKQTIQLTGEKTNYMGKRKYTSTVIIK